MKTIKNLFAYLFKTRRETVRTAKYTADGIQYIYDNRTEIKCYRDNYDNSPNLYMTINNKGKVGGSAHCKESMCIYIRDYIRVKEKHWMLGITRNSVDLQGVLDTSNAIHDLESSLNFKMHSLVCYSIPENKKIIWAFRLDPQWYVSPPLMSYFMGVLRDLFNNKNVPTEYIMYKLLTKMRPNEIFGRDKRQNWSLRGKFINTNEGLFNPTYGVVRFVCDLQDKNIQVLGKKFPKNKLFVDGKSILE